MPPTQCSTVSLALLTWHRPNTFCYKTTQRHALWFSNWYSSRNNWEIFTSNHKFLISHTSTITINYRLPGCHGRSHNLLPNSQPVADVTRYVTSLRWIVVISSYDCVYSCIGLLYCCQMRRYISLSDLCCKLTKKHCSADVGGREKARSILLEASATFELKLRLTFARSAHIRTENVMGNNGETLYGPTHV